MKEGTALLQTVCPTFLNTPPAGEMQVLFLRRNSPGERINYPSGEREVWGWRVGLGFSLEK